MVNSNGLKQNKLEFEFGKILFQWVDINNSLKVKAQTPKRELCECTYLDLYNYIIMQNAYDH